MAYEDISWHVNGENFKIGVDRLGSGPVVLFLPAMSSISTRGEMLPLQKYLAADFTTLSIDWPGFGDQSKPYANWRPELYIQFLEFLLGEIVIKPYAIICAGHACSYLLKHFSNNKTSDEKLIFLSPTWRGPLPTMLNGKREILQGIPKAFDIPFLGAILYWLNVNRLIIWLMSRGHIYSEPGWLKGERFRQKLAVAKSKGARYSSVRFVTGGIDPFHARDEQIEAAKNINAPILNIYSTESPRKSKSDMEALSTLQNVTTVRIEKGKLSFYEEFPGIAAIEIRHYLKIQNTTRKLNFA